MKAYLECYPCFLRQALESARMATADEVIQRRVLQMVAELIADFPPDATPIEMGEDIHRIIREITDSSDPYHEVKQESNDHALSLYPQMREIVETSTDPLLTAVKLAVIGNVIDFGANPDFDLERAIEEGLTEEMADSDFRLFSDRLKRVDEVLYIGDNTGEIVFDKILVEELVGLGKEVTFVVRGGPILNDVTMEDARTVGMDKVAEVISSGSLSPGTILRNTQPAFLARFQRAELILAKGQGNYEGLSEEAGPLFFLLKVKCPVIARHLGAEMGDLVFRAQTESGRENP